MISISSPCYSSGYWLYFRQAGTLTLRSASVTPPVFVLAVVRTRSPIDWYHYTAYNLAVNPGDDYVFAEREVYRDRLSNLVRCMDPRKFVLSYSNILHSIIGLSIPFSLVCCGHQCGKPTLSFCSR